MLDSTKKGLCMTIEADTHTFTSRPPAISKDDFLAKAVPEKTVLRDQLLYLVPKVFSTGSYGWSCSDRMTMFVEDKPVAVFVNLTLTIAGSKPSGASIPSGRQTLPAATLPNESLATRMEALNRRTMK
jgi:hypothetical protein